MKKLVLLPFLFSSALLSAQSGYQISVTLKPFRNQYIYLGHYSGKQFPIVDSVKLNDKGEGIFKGTRALGGGIYVVAYPTKDRFIEMLVDKQQKFGLIADTADLAHKKFINSPDNDLFIAYQQQMQQKGKALETANAGLRTSLTPQDSAAWKDKVKKAGDDIAAYRQQIITKYPQSFLSVLMHLMQEPVIPPAAKQPGGKYDSVFAYHYFKEHYWDGIDFWDDRVTRTPASLFEDRIDKYFNTLVYPSADSVNHEIDWMLGYATPSKEMTRVLLVKFVTRYLNMKYMWEDAVFVHLYEKYFAHQEYEWLTESGRKLITDRAYNLMANIMGNPAENISLPDSNGHTQSLYSDTARFTIVCFWDPTCGHCRETVPLLDSMYRTRWKAEGVKIFAVGKETDGTRKDWLDFIREHRLEGWMNVYYSKADEKSRVDANIPGYVQLYDAQVVPAIYLLDREKRIIAKKLTWQQTDDILQLKLKNQ